MDFSHIKSVVIPEGNVKQIDDVNGNTLWKSGPNRYYLIKDGIILFPYTLYRTKITQNSASVKLYQGANSHNEFWFDNAINTSPYSSLVMVVSAKATKFTPNAYGGAGFGLGNSMVNNSSIVSATSLYSEYLRFSTISGSATETHTIVTSGTYFVGIDFEGASSPQQHITITDFYFTNE